MKPKVSVLTLEMTVTCASVLLLAAPCWVKVEGTSVITLLFWHLSLIQLFQKDWIEQLSFLASLVLSNNDTVFSFQNSE